MSQNFNACCFLCAMLTRETQWKNSSSLILTLSFSLLVFCIRILAPATCGHSRSSILGAVSRSFIIQSINNYLLIIYLLCTRHCSRAGNAEMSKTIQLPTLMLHFNLMSRRGEVMVTISQAFQRRAERDVMLPWKRHNSPWPENHSTCSLSPSLPSSFSLILSRLTLSSLNSNLLGYRRPITMFNIFFYIVHLLNRMWLLYLY